MRREQERRPKWARWDDDDHYPTCDSCESFARWSIGNFEDDAAVNATIRWFACGAHLNRVLIGADWELDAVMVYDLTEPGGKA